MMVTARRIEPLFRTAHRRPMRGICAARRLLSPRGRRAGRCSGDRHIAGTKPKRPNPTASLIFIVLMDPTLGLLNLLTGAVGLGRFGFFRDPDQALWSLMLLASWKGCGYWMIFLLAGLLAVPRDTLEAARIDGAGYFQRLRHVVVPQMMRTFLFVLVADTVANFLLFVPVYIITQGGPNGRTDVLMHRGCQEAFGMLDHGAALAISTMPLLMVGSLAALMFRLMRER
jgi:multiple sugar transport system permease protein